MKLALILRRISKQVKAGVGFRSHNLDPDSPTGVAGHTVGVRFKARPNREFESEQSRYDQIIEGLSAPPILDDPYYDLPEDRTN